MSVTNIGYWEKVLQNPTPAYKALIDGEKQYLLEKLSSNLEVLDVGCGDGRNIKTILAKAKHVVGIDNDDIAINDAKKNFLHAKNVEIIKADATAIPFPPKTFDAVIFFDILQNLDLKKEEALKEAKRVLKDDGVILLCAYSEDAFSERMKMYEIIAVPINNTQKTKINFEKGVGANVSEQFSVNDINDLANKAGLQVTDSKKIGNIAHLCTLTKVVV